MSSNCGGCFCKCDTLVLPVTVVVVSFGFLSMFGVLIPTGIFAVDALRAPSAIAFDGLKVTAMFIACAAYVAAGVCAILDLRFIAINKRRNFIITTVGYVAAAFFLVTSGMTLFYNFMLIDAISSIPHLAPQFVSCVVLIGCYTTYLILQPYIEEKQKTNTSVSRYELHHNQPEMQ